MTERTRYFIDTSALIALHDSNDQNHDILINHLKPSGLLLEGITSNLVLTEFLTFFSRLGSVNSAVAFQQDLLANPQIQIIWTDRALHQNAIRHLKKFSDKNLSFTDAVSFAVMQDKKLKTALTFNDDFTKAGFQRLP